MKKLIALILALVSCLSLCACGSGSSPAAKATEIIPLTPVSVGDFEFTVAQYKYISKIPSDGGSVLIQGFLEETGNYVQIDFNIKYTGKTEKVVEHLGSFFSLEYGDGFVITDRAGLFVDSRRGSGWINVYANEHFQPLSEGKSCRYYFAIPAEVKANTEEPLLFVIDIDGERATLDLRK